VERKPFKNTPYTYSLLAKRVISIRVSERAALFNNLSSQYTDEQVYSIKVEPVGVTGQTFCKLAGSGGYFAGSPALQSSCDRTAPACTQPTHSLSHTPLRTLHRLIDQRRDRELASHAPN